MKFTYLENLDDKKIGRSVEEFLHMLNGPTHIKLKGKDSTRCRAVVTLLHGNEPSGLAAVYHLIKQQTEPAVDTHVFIPSVKTALEPPGFFYRSLPEVRDLNRCFKPPFNDAPGKLAEKLLETLEALSPEAIIDIHNTSGSGPSFAVTTFMDERHDALASFFTQRTIVTDLKLGALMEVSETLCPTVTIEVGGAQDDESILLASEGLSKFVTSENVLQPLPSDFDMEYFHNPIRLELNDRNNTPLAYGGRPMAGGITLKSDIEHHNFGYVTPDIPLGYIEKHNMTLLTAKNTSGQELRDEYFHSVDGILFPKQNLKLFMITTNADIARSDCLLYLVPHS